MGRTSPFSTNAYTYRGTIESPSHIHKVTRPTRFLGIINGKLNSPFSFFDLTTKGNINLEKALI